jgi:hypothetical protein
MSSRYAKRKPRFIPSHPLVTVSDIYNWAFTLPGNPRIRVIENFENFTVEIFFHRQHRRRFNWTAIKMQLTAGTGLELRQVSHTDLRTNGIAK